MARRAGAGGWRGRAAALAAVAASASILLGAPIGRAATAPSAAAPTGPVHVHAKLPDLAGRPIGFGAARFLGAMPKKSAGVPVIGIAASGSDGYWLATADGGVFSFGRARFHGSIALPPNDAMVGIEPTSDRGGYWMVSRSGGVYSFGDARFHGSESGRVISGSIVAFAGGLHGRGYWLVSSTGTVYCLGGVKDYGSAPRHQSIVAMAANPAGDGYWLLSSKGQVFGFGAARNYGGALGRRGLAPFVAMAASPDGRGYWLVTSAGSVLPYGDARFFGSAVHSVSKNPIVDVAATPDGRGYWLLPTSPPAPAAVGLPPPGGGFVPGHTTAIGDSVMLDVKPDLVADIPGIDVEAAVSRQWDAGVALAQQLKSEGTLGAIVVVDLGTNGPVDAPQFADMMSVLAGASRVVFVTVHLPPSYSWSQSVNATLEQGVPKYPRARLADFNKLAAENPQWFYSDGVHMPIGGAGAQAMASLIKSKI